MNPCSFVFFIGLLGLSSFFLFIPSLRARQIIISACNLAFIATYLGTDYSGWLATGIFVLSGYGMALLSIRLRGLRWRSPLITTYVVLLLFSFCLLKHYQFLQSVLPSAAFVTLNIIGLSYMLFRQIHFVIDVAEEQIEAPSLWEYVNYQFNLFALTAGPIQRFQDFRTSWSSLAPIATTREEVLATYARMMLGGIKVAVLGTFVLKATEAAGAHPLTITRLRDVFSFAVVFYGYPLFIYLNFSGYCDVVIAGARLLGIALPENFNYPFLARNMIDYWTRWHMTLGLWIRDYLFIPLYKTWSERLPGHGQMGANLCYFVALFLTGVWHGSTWNFVVFGLLNGLGVATAKAWEGVLTSRLGRQGFRTYLKNRPIHALAVIMNYHYVCLTILFFPIDLAGRLAFLGHFFCGSNSVP